MSTSFQTVNLILEIHPWYLSCSAQRPALKLCGLKPSFTYYHPVCSATLPPPILSQDLLDNTTVPLLNQDLFEFAVAGFHP